MQVNKFDKLHSAFVGNANEAILVWLAEQLGVSLQSLHDLQVGYVPVVEFKGGKKSYGWFSVPFRDSAGKIIGFSLRDREGAKYNYPGSNHGCIYAINPKHRAGDHGYSAGPHNWTRAMDSGELCPICHKPDGCLLSSDNPNDPKAVICIRTVSPKRLSFGWLHIRKKEGFLASESLIGGDGAVLSVEGMSDTAAAMMLGYAAIGRPGNMMGQEITGELVRGRPLIVLGENDLKSDGKWPGRDGMIATYQHCRKFTHAAKMVMPPDGVKDLRVWVAVNGLTREGFEEYVAKSATEKVDNAILPNNDPITVAERFLIDTHYEERRHLLRRWENGWYLYDPSEGRYVPTKDEPIRADFYNWSVGKQHEVETGKSTEFGRLVLNTASWANFLQAGEAKTLIRTKTIPAWINGATGQDPKDVVVFNNGLLDVPAYLEDADAPLQATTPDFFNTTALTVPFNPAARCEVWLAFLQSSLGDDPEKIALLQEWFGYCLTSDTSRQKLMYFRGESGSGKGTILRVLQSLVGPQQYASSSLSQLAEPFGLSPLIGKLICVIGDARVSRHMDAMRGLEVLLGITGGDAMQINRKFKDQLEGSYLTTRITIASNDFLDVPDHSGAMLRRLNVLQFARNFRENPDTSLVGRLISEVDGIATWALQGLRRLRDRGEFTTPRSSTEALAEWERDTNPLIAWMQDCTQIRPAVISDKSELYDCWMNWAKETHRTTWTRSVFLRRLQSNASYTTDVGSGIKGLEIQPHAARRFLGKP